MKNNKKGNGLIWIILIGFIIVATITNPTKDDFKDYVSSEFFNGSSLPVLIIEHTISETDYVVFSIYEVEISGEAYSFLALFNNFIPQSDILQLIEDIKEIQ
jgi:hypothetical protein